MFKVFREEVKKNPWTISFLVSCLLIPACFKNFLLPMTDLTFWQFTIPKIPVYMLTTVIVCIVGDELSQVGSLKKGEVKKEESLVQKMHFLVEIVMTLMTVGFVVWSGIVFKNKIEDFKLEEQKAVQKKGFYQDEEDDDVKINLCEGDAKE